MSETSHYLLIRTPEIESISLNDAISGEINCFQSENLELILTGATSIAANVKVKFLKAYLTGASTLQLTGDAGGVSSIIYEGTNNTEIQSGHLSNFIKNNI